MKSFWFAFVLVCTASEVVWADNVNAPLETTGMSSTGLFGTIIDAKTKQPIQNAVIQVAWVEHAEGDKNKKGGQRTKRLWVRQVFSGAGGRFDFANRRQIPDAPGWKFLPGQDPIVRIYAKGHHRLVIDNTVKGKIGSPIPINLPDAAEQKWVGTGLAQALRPLPDKEAALVKELALWKKDLENEITLSSAPDRESAVRSQGKLLALFDEACNSLPAPKKTRLCYAADSEFGQFLAQEKAERSKFLVVEEPDGHVKKYPLQFHAAPAPLVAPQQIGPPPSPNAATTQGSIGTSHSALPPGK